MAIAKVADRGARNSTATGDATVTLTNPTLITPGNYLIARIAVDNSGSAGARPGLAITDSRGHTWTDPAGALQDPGAASAGAACYLAYVRVDVPFQDGDTVLFDYTNGSPLSAIVIEEWTGIRSVTPLAVSQVTANGLSSTTQPAITIGPTAAGQLVYVACAAEQRGSEWGAQDSDTTNGSWSDLTKDSADTGTHDTSMSVYGGYKIVNASGNQTWNNTLSVAGDWAACAVVFAPELDVPEFAHRRRFFLLGEDEPYFAKPRKLNPAIHYVVPTVNGTATAGLAVVATAAGGQPPTDIIPAPAHYVQGEPADYFQKARRFNPALAPAAAAVGGLVSAQLSVVVTAVGSQQSGLIAAPRWTVIDGDPPEYLRRRRPVNPALYAVTAAASGTAAPRLAVVATAVETRQTGGSISARLAVSASVAGSRQTGGLAVAASSTIAKTAGAQGSVVGGVLSARLSVVATAAGSRGATGAAAARAVAVATAVEGRQAGGQTVAAATVVARTTGAQGNVIGGVVSARLTVIATTAASRGAIGAASAPAAAVATPAEKRGAAGGTVAVAVAHARLAGAQGNVVGGAVTARCTVIARTAGSRGALGAVSAQLSVQGRPAGSRQATGSRTLATAAVIVLASERRAVIAAAASARFAVVATAISRKGAAGQARAVGVVWSIATHEPPVVVGDVFLTVDGRRVAVSISGEQASLAAAPLGGEVSVEVSP